jgi:hypothetical protein
MRDFYYGLIVPMAIGITSFICESVSYSLESEVGAEPYLLFFCHFFCLQDIPSLTHTLAGFWRFTHKIFFWWSSLVKGANRLEQSFFTAGTYAQESLFFVLLG